MCSIIHFITYLSHKNRKNNSIVHFVTLFTLYLLSESKIMMTVQILNRAADFADIYYGEHNTTEEYITECLYAEMAEFTSCGGIIWKEKDGVMYLYTDEDLLTMEGIKTAELETLIDLEQIIFKSDN